MAGSGRTNDIEEKGEELRRDYRRIRRRMRKGKDLTPNQRRLYQSLKPDNDDLSEPDPESLRFQAFSKTRDPKKHFTRAEILERMEDDLGRDVVKKLQEEALAIIKSTREPEPTVVPNVEKPALPSETPIISTTESKADTSASDDFTPLIVVRFRPTLKTDDESQHASKNPHEDQRFLEQVRFLQRILLHMQRIREIEEKVAYAKKLAQNKKYSRWFFEAMEAVEGRWHLPALSGLKIHGEALRAFILDEGVRSRTMVTIDRFAAFRNLTFPQLQKLRETNSAIGDFLKTDDGKLIKRTFLRKMIKPVELDDDLPLEL